MKDVNVETLICLKIKQTVRREKKRVRLQTCTPGELKFTVTENTRRYLTRKVKDIRLFNPELIKKSAEFQVNFSTILD